MERRLNPAVPAAACLLAFLFCSTTSEKPGVPPGALAGEVQGGTAAGEQEAGEWLTNLKKANPEPVAFQARFKINANLDKKKYNALVDLYVDRSKKFVKLVLKDPLFESKINTIRVEQGTAQVYDHQRRSKFELPATSLRLRELLGDALSFAYFQPFIENRLPDEIYSNRYTQVYPVKNRVYVNAPGYEAVYDFRQMSLARLIIREKTTRQRVLITSTGRINKGNYHFPGKIFIAQPEAEATASLVFQYVRVVKAFSAATYNFP